MTNKKQRRKEHEERYANFPSTSTTWRVVSQLFLPHPTKWLNEVVVFMPTVERPFEASLVPPRNLRSLVYGHLRALFAIEGRQVEHFHIVWNSGAISTSLLSTCRYIQWSTPFRPLDELFNSNRDKVKMQSGYSNAEDTPLNFYTGVIHNDTYFRRHESILCDYIFQVEPVR